MPAVPGRQAQAAAASPGGVGFTHWGGNTVSPQDSGPQEPAGSDGEAPEQQPGQQQGQRPAAGQPGQPRWPSEAPSGQWQGQQGQQQSGQWPGQQGQQPWGQPPAQQSWGQQPWGQAQGQQRPTTMGPTTMGPSPRPTTPTTTMGPTRRPAICPTTMGPTPVMGSPSPGLAGRSDRRRTLRPAPLHGTAETRHCPVASIALRGNHGRFLPDHPS